MVSGRVGMRNRRPHPDAGTDCDTDSGVHSDAPSDAHADTDCNTNKRAVRYAHQHRNVIVPSNAHTHIYTHTHIYAIG